MKTIWWVLIILGASVFILGFMLVVPVLILDKSWWWFFGTLIGLIVAGLIVGAIILILKLRKKKPSEIKLSITKAKARAIYEMKMDTDNPDNFKIKNSKLERWGEKGLEKTPILILDGIGTELGQRRVVIMNLNNPKQESTWLTDCSDDEIKISVRLMAEHPPEEEIREVRETGLDEFGRPRTIIRTRKPSSAEVKLETEKKVTEEIGAI